jgi:polyhydroxyalkanoate synthase
MADNQNLLDEMAHWTGVAGRMQQMLMEHGASAALKIVDDTAELMAKGAFDPQKFAEQQTAWWKDAMAQWQAMLPVGGDKASSDRRFRGARWEEPLFDMIRQSYVAVADKLVQSVDALDGIEPRMKEQLRFATQSFVEAMSPANFALTNPQVLERIVETRGANLITGLERMIADMSAGQIRHVGENMFEIGKTIATTPGKVIHETPLYQLIHYAPTTPDVQATPLIIFPPWINRFYILDLSPEKSFVKWAVDQGLSVFIVSWKSADASMADMTMDDYVLRGERDAIDTVRDLLDVPSVHVVGYCVAGTALSMLLAWLAAKGEADKIATATFFTAQVDFTQAGDLGLFVDDAQLAMIESLATDGYLDGRYMGATFNLLRGRDLIWNYVVNNYLLADPYKPFDLLHWNSDVTNLPANWHRAYLADFYRDNKLVKGETTVDGIPIDLKTVETPSYVQAGREDHIAPPESVWKMTHHFSGPLKFVLAGSGHIAGVVNPPAAAKYQYWTNDTAADTLDAFVAGATEHKGSWWPDWLAWIGERSGGTVPAKGARIPGRGKRKAIEDAPGRYVVTR